MRKNIRKSICFFILFNFVSSYLFANQPISNKTLQKLPFLPWPYIIDLSTYNENFSKLPQIEFYFLNTKESFNSSVYEPNGEILNSTLEQFSFHMRDSHNNKIFPIDERLLKILYKTAHHFNATKVIIVSGFRSGHKWRRWKGEKTIGSNHAWGKAVDFNIPDIKTSDLSVYARTLGKVGVGYYPNDEFMHLDIRDASYFWVNKCKPGRRGWDRPLMRHWAVEIDKNWTPHWDLPWTEVPEKYLETSEEIKTDNKLLNWQKRQKKIKNYKSKRSSKTKH